MPGRIGLKTMANFSKQVSISIGAGLALTRALSVIVRESRDRRLKKTLEGVKRDIMEGNTLADALRKRGSMFPPIFVEMVAAGEGTGHLDEVFRRLALYFDTRLMLRRATIRACVYPAIQLTLAFAVFSLILILFSSDKRATAESIVFYSIAAVICVILGIYFFSRTSLGRAIRDRLALMVPPFRSVTIKLCMARFTRTLAMQLESGIPVTQAIERAARVTGNAPVARNITKIVDPIRQGSTLAEAVQKARLMPPMIREVLAVGEETGSFTQALERVANIYEDEALVVLESLPKFIGPVVVIIVGIIVLYLLYTVYFVHYLQPLLEMTGM